MINPTEQTLQRYWDRIQRALQVLQKAQRYELVSRATGATVVESSSGDYVDFIDVRAAIDILLEGQQ